MTTSKQDFRIEMLALQLPWRNKDLQVYSFNCGSCPTIMVVKYHLFCTTTYFNLRGSQTVCKGTARKAFACCSLSRLSGPEASTRLSARSTSQNFTEARRHLSFVSIKRAKLSSIAVPLLSWNYPTAKILFSHSLEAFKQVTWSWTETGVCPVVLEADIFNDLMIHKLLIMNAWQLSNFQGPFACETTDLKIGDMFCEVQLSLSPQLICLSLSNCSQKVLVQQRVCLTQSVKECFTICSIFCRLF